MARLLSHPPTDEAPLDEIEREENSEEHDHSYPPHDAYPSEEGKDEDRDDSQDSLKKSE